MSFQHLRAAIEFHLRNRFQEALDIYVALLQTNPDDVHARHLLGVLLIQNGQVATGEAFIAEAIARKGHYPEAEHNRRILKGCAAAKHAREAQGSGDDPYPVHQPGTVDDWRHLRMTDFAACFTEHQGTWLTIGDHYGHDALRIRAHGIASVTVSNLSTGFLEKARQLGFIENFLQLNAEHLDLPDETFDYVVCKEALHHMPRPMLAIYEMLRVARKAVFLIEPSDPLIDWSPPPGGVTLTRQIESDEQVGSLLRYTTPEGAEVLNRYIDWWEDGPYNYVYTLSRREICKLSLGLGLPSYAVKCFNDFYRAEWASQPADSASEGLRLTREQISLFDHLCATTGIPKNYVVGMFFKETPDPATVEKLRQSGCEVHLTRTRFLPLQWPTLPADEPST